MNIQAFVLMAGLFLALAPNAQGTPAKLFADADQFFRQHVRDGAVDYDAIRASPQKLDHMIRKLETMDLKNTSKETQKAFWINAYNLTVIKSVLAHYPLPSPLKVKGFFDKARHTVASESMTLNDLENKKLREAFSDARIHFALVCAARGCPKLAEFAYVPDKLDKQLDARTRLALNSDSFIRVKTEASKVLISEIFKWYRKDFTTGGKSLLQYINQYRREPIPAHFSVGYYPYDWALNKQ